MIPLSIVPFDTAIEFALRTKTFPPNRVTGIAAVTSTDELTSNNQSIFTANLLCEFERVIAL